MRNFRKKNREAKKIKLKKGGNFQHVREKQRTTMTQDAIEKEKPKNGSAFLRNKNNIEVLPTKISNKRKNRAASPRLLARLAELEKITGGSAHPEPPNFFFLIYLSIKKKFSLCQKKFFIYYKKIFSVVGKSQVEISNCFIYFPTCLALSPQTAIENSAAFALPRSVRYQPGFLFVRQ